MAKRFLLILCFSAGFVAFGQTVADFEAVVDFAVTLKDMSEAIDSPSRLSTKRFYVISGTVGDVNPKSAWFFTLQPSDIADPAVFTTRILAGREALPLFLKKSLAPGTVSLLNAYRSGTSPSDELLAGLLRDINEQIKSFLKEVRDD